MTWLNSDAAFSRCGRYRYRLSRDWGSGPRVCFIMLNPSTADETRDDPTIRRCIAFAKSWGMGGLEVLNIFALRSTNPGALYAAEDPVGPDNDGVIEGLVKGLGNAVCAWGTHGALRGRGLEVLALINRHFCPTALRLTKNGHPAHPLYLPRHLKPRLFPPEAA